MMCASAVDPVRHGRAPPYSVLVAGLAILVVILMGASLAIGYAPMYLEENADAIRNSWPRVPLPRTREMLEVSAQLGASLAALLDVDTPLPGLDADPLPRLEPIASISPLDRAPGPLDLSLTAGWAVAQTRTVKSGAVGRVVMPGDGRVDWRLRSASEAATLSDHERQQLGDEIVDVYLNAETAWLGVPGTVWNYKIGGYQVLRKWLAYREEAILGRPLTSAEVRQFQSIARRLAELVRLGADLNANYQACTGTVEQDPLPLVMSVASD